MDRKAGLRSAFAEQSLNNLTDCPVNGCVLAPVRIEHHNIAVLCPDGRDGRKHTTGGQPRSPGNGAKSARISLTRLFGRSGLNVITEPRARSTAHRVFVGHEGLRPRSTDVEFFGILGALAAYYGS